MIDMRAVVDVVAVPVIGTHIVLGAVGLYSATVSDLTQYRRFEAATASLLQQWLGTVPPEFDPASLVVIPAEDPISSPPDYSKEILSAFFPRIWLDVFEKVSVVRRFEVTVPGSPPTPLPVDSPAFAFGGSFDGIHAGHLAPLNVAVDLLCLSTSAKLLIMGLSDDFVVQKKPGCCKYDLAKRTDIVSRIIRALMKVRGWNELAEVSEVPPMLREVEAVKSEYMITQLVFGKQGHGSAFVVISNLGVRNPAAGIALDLPSLDLLIATEETVPGAQALNAGRERKGMKPLRVHVCPVVGQSGTLPDESWSSKIASRKIRSELEEDLAWLRQQFPEAVATITEKNRFNEFAIEVVRPILMPFIRRSRSQSAAVFQSMLGQLFHAPGVRSPLRTSASFIDCFL